MENFLPEVQITAKKRGKRISYFAINVKISLPENSKTKTTGEGELPDNVLYRPLIISHDGDSENFKVFSFDFRVYRKDVGLLERGCNIKVRSAGDVIVPPMETTMMRTAEYNSGTQFDYTDE